MRNLSVSKEPDTARFVPTETKRQTNAIVLSAERVPKEYLPGSTLRQKAMGKMSKKCIWCGCEVNPGLAGKGYYCPHCDEDLTEDGVNDMTVFDRITQSEETLAVEFVGMMYDRVSGNDRYYSMLTGEFYNDYAEALEATVAKLKEVAEKCCGQ